jgi:hypothetical protein
VGGVNKRVSIKDITSPALGVALSTPEWRMYTNACSYSIIHTQPSHSTHTQRFVQVYSLLSKTTPRGPTAYGAYRGTSLTRNPSMYSAPGRIAGRHREQYTIFFHHSSNGLLAVDRGQYHLDIAKPPLGLVAVLRIDPLDVLVGPVAVYVAFPGAEEEGVALRAVRVDDDRVVVHLLRPPLLRVHDVHVLAPLHVLGEPRHALHLVCLLVEPRLDAAVLALEVRGPARARPLYHMDHPRQATSCGRRTDKHDLVADGVWKGR